jgi:hypothetical protein
MSDYFTYSSLSDGVTGRVGPLNTIFAALSAAFDMLPTEDQLKLGLTQFGTDSGAANAYVVALPHTVTEYTNGMVVTFVPANTSTSATVTLNVDSVGAKTVTLSDGSSPAVGIIKADYFTTVMYNETNDKWEIQGISTDTAYDVSATIAAAIATHNAAIAVTGGTITGITDLAVADGGTGASTAVAALVNLGLTATAAEINSTCDGIGVTLPKQKIVEIGAWNMYSSGGGTGSTTKNTAHGLTLSKIIGCRVLIQDDAGAKYDMTFGSGGYFNLSATNVQMTATGSNYFDDPGFDLTTDDYNRGWIILDYID